MKTKILLVEDDDGNRQLLKTALEVEGYQVVTAPNGKIAQSLVSIYDNFMGCVSDIEMPGANGITLLHFIQRTRPMPVVLLSGPDDLQDEREAQELGAARLIKKPVQMKELLTALEECLAVAAAQQATLDAAAAVDAKARAEAAEKLAASETEFHKKAKAHAEELAAAKKAQSKTPGGTWLEPSKLDDLVDPKRHSDSLVLEDDGVDHDHDFCRISIRDFISGTELQYDIYIRIKAQKYLKIAHQGNSFTSENLNAYKTRGIEHLYMAKVDFQKYVGFSISLSNMVTSSPSLTKAKKIQFLKHAAEMIATQMHLDGVNEESFENAKSIMESSLSVMSDSEELLSMLTMLNSASDATYSHSIGVSLYATMLAKAVGMNSPLVLFKVCMGGMLHDIGKKELPAPILNRPRYQLNAEEVKVYESHTLRGAEILSKLPFVHGDIVKIAAQHHENCLGLGYPANLKIDFIHPLARLISVANEFCGLAIRSPGVEPLAPSQAIERMSDVFQDTLDPVFFVTLAKLFNVKLNPAYHDAHRKNKRAEPAHGAVKRTS